MSIQPGDVIASKYRVDGVLGTGGMGVVLGATHLELEQRVAIKLPLPQQVAEPTFAARFMREGRNAVKIRSDHVARVLDVGRTDDGSPFLVMEYLEGEDLARYLKKVVRLDVPHAVDILLQTCDAVAAAHAVGIVHRDLKPANLFLERRHDGSHAVKVLDFGISKVLVNDPAALEAALTSTTGVIGSPMYMSPEQMIAARNVDTRTDVWSLGLILFKCLTGKTPWPSGNVIELAARISRDPPLRPRELVPNIPEAIEAAIMGCLEKDRERRIGSAIELATAIAAFDPGRGELTLRRMRRVNGPPPELARASVPDLEAPSETLATSAFTLHTAHDGTEHAPRVSSAGWPTGVGPIVSAPVAKRTERMIVPAAGPQPVEPLSAEHASPTATTGLASYKRASATRVAVVIAVVSLAALLGVIALVRASFQAPPAAQTATTSEPKSVAAAPPAKVIAPPPSEPEPAVASSQPAEPTAPPVVTVTKPAVTAKTTASAAPAKAKPDATHAPAAAKTGGDPWGAW